MSLWKVAWRSIQQRALASGLTAFSMGLGVALVVAVLVIHSVVDQSFRRGSQGYNLIVGAKGSSLALVMNTVFYLNLNQPLQTIPYTYYREFTEGRFVPAVETAIPVCTGHDYRGYPAIATSSEMFSKLKYMGDRGYEFAAGRNFDDEAHFEAVVGATVARQAGLKVGEKFQPVASVPAGAGVGHRDEMDFEIVGILAPTGTPADRAIFMNIEGFFRCPAHQQGPTAAEKLLRGSEGKGAAKEATDENRRLPPAASDASATDKSAASDASDEHKHDAEHEHDAKHDHDHDHDADHDHDIHRALTAILVCTYESRPQVAMNLERIVNDEPVAQAIYPSRVVYQLFDDIIGNVQKVLLTLAVLVVVVAGIGILVSIYNSMSDRRHEIAIMRALGASRFIVMSVILLESILLSLGGGAIGLLLGHGLVAALGPMIAEQTRVAVSPFDFQWIELVLIPGLVFLATLVGYLPAVAAYRTDVAKSLSAGP